MLGVSFVLCPCLLLCVPVSENELLFCKCFSSGWIGPGREKGWLTHWPSPILGTVAKVRREAFCRSSGAGPDSCGEAASQRQSQGSGQSPPGSHTALSRRDEEGGRGGGAPPRSRGQCSRGRFPTTRHCLRSPDLGSTVALLEYWTMSERCPEGCAHC